MVALCVGAEGVVKWVVFAVLLLCMPAVLFGWLGCPLSSPVHGFSYHLLWATRIGKHRSIASYGMAAVVLIALAAYGRAIDSFRVIFWAGAALALLDLAAVLQISFFDPVLFRHLCQEEAWLESVASFSRHNLLPNYGTTPTDWRFMPLDTLSQRASAGWFMMGVSWYVVLGIAIPCIIAGWMFTRPRKARMIVIPALLALAVVYLFIRRPLAGEEALIAAVRADSHGNPAQAVEDYRRAMQLDQWNALRIDLRQRIGAIDAGMGRTSTDDYRIYAAENDVDLMQYDRAIAEYQTLAAMGGPVASLARDRAVDLLNNFGLRLYGVGAFGGAANAWQRALNQDPNNWLTAFCLTRAYYVIGHYDESARIARNFLHASDPSYVADMHSDLGDSLTQMGEFNEGHISYYQSYILDYVYNRRGIGSLVGQ